MDHAGLEPVTMEDFVRVVEDMAFENGIETGALAEARAAWLDAFDPRGLALLAAEREPIRTEASIDRLRFWRRRAATMPSATKVLTDDPARRRALH